MGRPIEKVEKKDSMGRPIEKEGHSCCGCCCDVRRATIIVFGILLIIRIIYMIGVPLIHMNTDIENLVEPGAMFYTIEAIYIAFAMFAIYGAIIFNITMVGVTAFLQVCNVLYRIYRTVMTGVEVTGLQIILISVLVAYPPIMLFKEMKEGIMTRESYKGKEEQSCCCV